MKINIVLIGFMGAGKTEVGRIIAKNTGLNFIDIDSLIEKQEGMTITEIFEKKGEKHFRDLETEILKKIEKIKVSDFKSDTFIGNDFKPDVLFVISTGGGMPAFNGNMKILKKIGTVIYLKADPSVIYERIKSETHRPVLGAGNFTLKSVQDKLKEREKFYGQADMTVYTDGLSTRGVAEEIEIFLNFC